MYLKNIKLLNFKNYEAEQFFFDANIVNFFGKNGMGKTNILDAIYYLCIGKSYRTSLEKNICRYNQDFFRIEAEFSDSEKIVFKVKPGSQKDIEVNGTKIEKILEHVGKYPIVFISPDDIFTILDSNEERRNFINNVIVQYDSLYLKHLAVYNKLLKKRNALLKDFQSRNYFDALLLETFTEQMIESVNYIHLKRKEFMIHFTDAFLLNYDKLSDGKERVDLIYKSQLDEETFLSLSKKSIDKDRILGRTNVGIHKDELQLIINTRPLKESGSQGQIKSFILAMKIAQANLLFQFSSRLPILLLDDIFDKLDPNRVEALLRIVEQHKFSQIFITDTHEGRVEQLLGPEVKINSFHIENGLVSR
jgi:DNA replication and repair protein RecF